MTETGAPAAGWYPDPEEPARYHRYWDGTQWTVRQLLPQLPPAPRVPVPPPEPREPLGLGFRVLGSAVGIGLVFVGVLGIAQLVVHVWGVQMIDDAAATGDIDRLDRYDTLNQVTAVTVAVLTLLVGIGWMVWQYRLAADVGPNAVRRTPPWHAWSWVIPFGNLWLPFQNVRDLWTHLRPGRRAGWLRWWWACWLVAALIGLFLERNPEDVTVESFKSTTSAAAFCDVVSLVATVLAVRIIRTLTSVGLARSRAEVRAASPGA